MSEHRAAAETVTHVSGLFVTYLSGRSETDDSAVTAGQPTY